MMETRSLAAKAAGACMLMGGLVSFVPSAGAQQASSGTTVTPLLAKNLTGIEGKEGVMLTVELAPGADSPKHRHNAHVFVYVLEGSVIMQVEGQPAQTLGAGQGFYEAPEDVHAVSRNASTTVPAKFLVFFVKDKGAPPLVPVP